MQDGSFTRIVRACGHHRIAFLAGWLAGWLEVKDQSIVPPTYINLGIECDLGGCMHGYVACTVPSDVMEALHSDNSNI